MSKINIALAGNPNSGKTTLFNDLTGSSQYVGNWPGVTVEKKEGKFKEDGDVVIQDLPGIYSLSPYTLEEVVTRNYLVNDNPDAIINIVDATNIERNLYLTTQILEIGIPVVIVLNMMDIIERNGDKIDISRLEESLECTVLTASALKGKGTKDAARKAVEIAKEHREHKAKSFLSHKTEEVVGKIERILVKEELFTDKHNNIRWYAIKFFERDEKIVEEFALSETGAAEIERITSEYEDKEDDTSEGIVISERYDYISGVIKKCVKTRNTGELTLSDKIDKVVTNRFLALPIFAVTMFLVYFLAISSVGTLMTDWVNETLFGEIIPNAAESFLASINCADWLSSLILDGIIAGVGAVLGFLPQMVVLFLCLAFLEDCGYMARIAFIMDRLFRRFGLSGKSFIPMLVATGCGVPGIMASRTIESDNDRRMTITTTTFIPCGAKLPIIALIAGALFGGAAWVAASAYFLGILAIIVSGLILKKTRLFSGEPTPFVMELPAYHLPPAKSVARTTFSRALSFVQRAGSIVLLATVVVWFLSSFDFSLNMVDTDVSILAAVGGVVSPIFAPLGFADWRAAVATITGLMAKENLVGTFGVLFNGAAAEISEDGAEYWGALSAAFTPIAAYSLLAFNLLCAPCFAAISAISREMVSAKWTFFAIGYQCVFAYVVALIIYQTGMFVSTGQFTFGTVLAFLFILLFIYMIFFMRSYGERKGSAVKPSFYTNSD